MNSTLLHSTRSVRLRRASALLGGVYAAIFVATASLAAEEAAALTPSAAGPQPHILLLVAEDLSPRIGAFGDDVARTPNLDELAREGVRFTNVFTTAGVCAPSRAALILGQHAIATGTQHMRTSTGPIGKYLAVPPAKVKAFPELLRRAGYYTYQHGKLDYQFSGPLSESGPSSIWDAEDNEGQWRDRAEDQPFFGMVNFMVTHESGMFEPLGTWPRGIFHFIMQVMQAYGRWGWTDEVVPTDPALVRLPPYYPDLPELRRDLAQHYDNIQIMDAQVGQILDRLEADGLADSTIVIWTTDHGDGLPRAKRELFDSGLHVPMIIRWPEGLRPADLSPGDLDERMVSFVDLTATILGMAGRAPPPFLHGRDFLAPETPRRDYIYAARDRIDDTLDRQRAVRSRHFKYIRSHHPDLPGGHPSAFRENLAGVRAWRRAFEAGDLSAQQRRWFEAPGAERLFDLSQDPHELHDVSRNPAYAETLERMRAADEAFGRRVPDLAGIPETELRLRFWPDGEQPQTASPTFRRRLDGRIEITSTTPGSSIEVSVEEHPPRPYVGPFEAREGSRIEAHAIRYGWRESPSVGWETPTP